ncbi:MAG: flagellar motor switch phosphatase FliY [Clostridiales bacterium]|jgi:flagellar motor switch protein FliN/FliY|nr:flagellar motor switch phosphatase FliY [Clostridiales bacterium]
MGDMLSQAEINALLGGMTAGGTDTNKNVDAAAPKGQAKASSPQLTGDEKDILGEIGNISMGTSATTLSALLGVRVLITTPRVDIIRWRSLSEGYDRPCVGIRVDYKEGIEGSNVMLLKDRDVKIISNLMMGGDGTEDIEGELNEIDLSAIAEAMNQMVGSASTSLASLVKMRIDIDTPHAFVLDFNDTSFQDNVAFTDDEVVCISFRMEIGTLVDSEIMQVLPMKFARDMVDILSVEIQPQAAAPQAQMPPPTQQASQMAPPAQQMPPPLAAAAPQPMPMPQPAPQQYYAPPQPAYQQPAPTVPLQNINVQPAQFQSFDMASVMQQKENIGIIMDVPLEVTVELGRTYKKIKDILEFSPGTIIELDKLAGEPIDILVNGKFVAKGEVVVIDENFGIRISEIINEELRV